MQSFPAGHIMGKKEIFAYVLEFLTVQCTVTVHMTDTPYTNKHTHHTQTNTHTTYTNKQTNTQ